MKKLRTEQVETIAVGSKHFRVPMAKARAVLVLLGDIPKLEPAEDLIPADEVFKDLHSKYTKRGSALRGARLKEEMTQIELATRLGITQGDLSKMEHGKRPIGKKMALRLSKILNIDYRVFL